jgi:hypothetical protein
MSKQPCGAIGRHEVGIGLVGGKAGKVHEMDQNSDPDVRMISRQPRMRTSESKELRQLIDSHCGFDFEVPMTNSPRS